MSSLPEDSIELADAGGGSLPAEDRRHRIAEPLPVRLVAVEDVRMIAPAGMAPDLDLFYVSLLGFERERVEQPIIYHADNHRLLIRTAPTPLERNDLRPVGIEVLNLHNIERKLIEREIEFEVQKGLTPGERALLLADPAGNWVQLSEAPLVR